MFSQHYDYGVYSLFIVILALLALIPLYRIIVFALKKERRYLRFTEYFAAIGLFLSNLLGLSHFRTSLLNLEYEGVVHNLKRMAPRTIELGVKQDFNLLFIEFFASVLFFFMLIIILVLKDRLSTTQLQTDD